MKDSKMKVCIITLGCKVNQYESAQIARKYMTEGHTVTLEFTDDADIYVVNTCAVTNFAEKKSRYQVSHIRRLAKNPSAQIIVCGCAGDRSVNKSASCFYAVQPRTRAFIKVQDGCNNFCSYCIVPILRGAPQNRPIPDIIAEIKAAGKPVVLTGINLSGFDNLTELCRQADKCGFPFELSSIEVNIFTDEFLSILSQCGNFIPKFHVPLQSASNKVLQDMNRKYTAEYYADKIALIRKYFDAPIITTDVIVGYPTETEPDFLLTYNFVKTIGYAKVHIFPFSRRDRTAAAKLPEIRPSIITDRAKRLADLCNKICK